MTDPMTAPRTDWWAETCREEVDHERCGLSADFILWGKLLPTEAFGPRCYDHAVKHLGHNMPSRADQYAVYDLRGFAARVAEERGEAWAEGLSAAQEEFYCEAKVSFGSCGVTDWIEKPQPTNPYRAALERGGA